MLRVFKGVVQAQIDAWPIGFDQPRRQQSIVGIDRIQNGLRADAEAQQLCGVEVNEHSLCSFSDEDCFLHARNALQAITNSLGFARQFPHRHALGCQCDQGEVDIRKVIVHDRSDDAARQTWRLVLHALSDLIQQVRNLFARRIVVKLDDDVSPAGSNTRLESIEIFNLLDAFFQSIDHLILHFFSGRARPDCRDDQCPYREGRILGTAERQKGIDARNH